jgi:hypothetical protein
MVLCRVGPHRMAFAALQVVSVEPVSQGDRRFTDSRHRLSKPGERGRALHGHQATLVVDSLEILPDAPLVFQVPSLLRLSVGESLAGFIQVKEELWPVFNLEPFARFLGRSAAPSEAS